MEVGEIFEQDADDWKVNPTISDLVVGKTGKGYTNVSQG